jgi:pantothenate synthetase
MKIIRRIKELKSEILNINNIGFVPTMGGLHIWILRFYCICL